MVAILLVLPVATADDSGTSGHSPENELRFAQFPQVYVNITNNASFNVSYLGLVLVSGAGIYFSNFPAEHWVAKRSSNISVDYVAKITFERLDTEHIGLIEKRFNLTNLQNNNLNHAEDQTEVESIQANASVSMVKKHITNAPSGNFTSTNLTGFKISFSLTSSQITGPGYLFLIQALGARINNGYERYHSLAQISHNLTTLNSTAIGVTSTNYDAYFWWDPTYTVNGHTENLSASSGQIGNTDILVFKFQFGKAGLHSLVQDPYFSIPQVNLFNNPILQKDIQNAAYFVILHIELFAAGLATGAALIGLSYASYRRKRF